MYYIRTLTGSGDDCIDLFHGFGGWSKAAFLNDLFVKWACNHDQHKADVHSANFPKTIHHVMDVRQTDPRQHPRTRVFLGSPCCNDFSQAKTHKTKLEHEAQMRLFHEDEKEREKAIAQRQKRATMWNVIDFINCHRYQIGVIENVVDVHRWSMFSEWVTDLRNLGYNFKILYLNSMFFHNLNGVTNCPPAPQSRDRWYCVFWRNGTPAPDLEFRPLAPCPNCGNVRAIQVWKNPKRQFGKYGIDNGSYYYGCPNCLEKYSLKGWRPAPASQHLLPGLDPDTGNHIIADRVRPLPVHPYYYCGLNAIDFSIPIQRVGDFKKPISPNTRARIEAGLRKYGGDPWLMNGNRWKYKSALLEPTFTQTTNAALPVLVDLAHTKGSPEGRVYSGMDVYPTQTTKDTLGVFWPSWLVELYHNGDLRPTTDPVQTVTAGGGKAGLVVPPFIATYNGGHSVLAGMNDAMPTATTNERHGLAIPETFSVDDCYYRTLRSKYEAKGEHGETILKSEIGRVMGFPQNFIFFGTTDEVTEGFGGAVTPGKGSWIVNRIKQVLDK